MSNSMMKKKNAALKSVEFVKDGMVLGLGSGSTMYWVLEALSERIEQGEHIQGIPSSVKTEKLAREFGIPLTDFSQVGTLDLAIDGADEFDPDFQLIKGGGGSLMREKIVDIAAETFVVVADDSKRVQQLGDFPLPVEVVQFGWESTKARIVALGCEAVLRQSQGQPFVTNNSQYILDCHFQSIENPHILHEQLKTIVGVVETGLFLDMADYIIVGSEERAEVYRKEGEQNDL
ncbi:ribose-5-phosphate isomerase RpiA [Alkalibacillus haloalkaliphilus]|uniref:ribose-5-phosphate isomerase RpiA n=1 Tax=Alkalibacillus haloalkaliphilus TaxID=94136 RepID=UPI0029361E89|nr:ribose-5-phosphate isomerase RpiA [Alkalibacillus haloalkaliphilus]MDV2582200.1 ribose-5-phosphate isomerase RpiA [Alkalibacillus haloalkaliphilus]